MTSLIETFHIDFNLLIAQIVNFAVIFLVLYWFALKPLIKVMQERTNRIEKSLVDARKIEDKLAMTEKEYNEEIVKAKKEAAEILEKANQLAEQSKKELVERTKEEIGQIIDREKMKIQQEKAATLKEIKREVTDLVMAVVEKVLDKKLDKKEDRELIRNLVKSK